MTDPSPEHVSFPAFTQAEWRSLFGRLAGGNLGSRDHLPGIPPHPGDTHTAPPHYDPPRTTKQDPR